MNEKYGIKRDNLMRELLSMEWNSKKLWEHIRDEELTAVPAFKGSMYNSMPIKIMYVGHALNGWEMDVSKCKSLDETVNTIVSQKGALESFVNKEGFEYITSSGKTRKYLHVNSNFFRLIKQILEFQNESDTPTDETWYNGSNWNQKFIWSNLYNIAPRKGGNPDDKMIKMGMAKYVELMKLQIEQYKPDIVVFCPLSGYFIPWKRQPSFADMLDKYSSCDEGPIIGKGKLGSSEIIVCRRPDRRGISHDEIREMARQISEYIDSMCK